MKTTTWNELPITEKLAIYNDYCADFEGFGFFDEPVSFEEFDEMLHNSTVSAVRKLYRKSA